MRARHPSSPLALIIAFKAFKTVTLATLGAALLATRHANPVDILTRLALAVHLPLSSELFARALTAAWNLSVGKQTALGVTAFAYAALMGTEGIALALRKPWARWFTIIATSSLVPVEIYEIAHDVHPVRVAILIVNLTIVIYLFNRKELFD